MTISSSIDSLSTNIFYFRHGEVPGNDPNSATYAYTGSGTDDSLTEKGVAQANACGKRVRDLIDKGVIEMPSAIYTSNLKRAVETSILVAKALGIDSSDIQKRSDLREISWGDADGQLVAEVSQKYSEEEKKVKSQYVDRRQRWEHLPVYKDAEKFSELYKRSIAEISSIGEKHQGQTLFIFGHGRVLKTLIADALDREENIPYPENCGIAQFTFSPSAGVRFVRVVPKEGV